MGSTYTDLIDGISTSTAFKAPVRVATTANITLSGEQTIDGVAVVSGDRVLVKDQTDSKENGIWVADTSAWERAKDFDGNRDVRKGTMVLVNEGALGAGTIWRVTSSDSITIGTDNITFSKSFVSVEFPIAADVDYANATSGLTAINVQDAIDELADEKFDKTGGAVSGDTEFSGSVTFSSTVAGVIPPGCVAWFAMDSAPSGWLKCNGAAVSRTTYADLFAAIGTTFGAGDGSTTFNLPDLRGEFLRGWDDGRGIDSSRSFGSSQADAIRNITGSITFSDNFDRGSFNGDGTGAIAGDSYGQNRISNTNPGSGDGYKKLTFDASRTVPTAGENRPRNVALLACIKY